MRKGTKALLWAALAIAVLVPVSYFGLDYAIKNAVASTLKEAERIIGRKITVRSVDTGPYTITAILHDLQVKGPDRKGVFVSISTVRLSKSISSYGRGATIINSLHLRAPSIHLERNADGSFNFNDIRVCGKTWPPAACFGCGRGGGKEVVETDVRRVHLGELVPAASLRQPRGPTATGFPLLIFTVAESRGVSL